MSAKVHIRQATKNDIPTLITLQRNDGFTHSYYLTRERLKRLFDRGELFFVARLGRVPVGFASIDCEIRAQVHFLSVDQTFTRRGIGSMLMRTLKNEVQKRGYGHLSVYVDAGAAIEVFLKKNGFVQVGYYKNRYGKGKDATIWEVDLSQSRSK